MKSVSFEDLERLVVISSDGHAGASIPAYREYLESRFHDDFDAWANDYVDGWDELERNAAEALTRIQSSTLETSVTVGVTVDSVETNWDSELRQRSIEADGVVGEVLFPNTVPPFYPRMSLGAPNPADRDEYEHRLAGLRAHNRWLADFCSQVPGRRAGVAQILINDVAEAVKDIQWVKDSGLFGGVALPGVAPGDGVPELFDPIYEPIWEACEDLGVPINRHGTGGGHAPYKSEAGAMTRMMFLVEVPIWSHRSLWHLILGGVFERHPKLKLVLTEQGTGWIPGVLATLDHLVSRVQIPGSAEAIFGYEALSQLSLKPSEYFARNCWVGASGLSPAEVALRHKVGVDKIMWGSDFPHSEGTFPFTKEAFRLMFTDAPIDETRQIAGATAAALYGFDPVALSEAAARVGPTIEEISRPLDAIPEGARRIVSFDTDDVVPAF